MNYKNINVYKLASNDENIKPFYIGSTSNLKKRCNLHRRNCNYKGSKAYNRKVYKFIRENGGFENWNMTVLSCVPCENNYEGRKIERKFFECLKPSLNTNYPQRSRQEYYIDNIDKYKKYYLDNKNKLLKYQKEYDDNHREKFKKKIYCVCGSYITKKNINKHKKSKKHKNYINSFYN